MFARWLEPEECICDAMFLPDVAAALVFPLAALVTSHDRHAWMLRRRRVFLGRRVVLFDHEVDRHAVQFLEHQRAIDHEILGQGIGDLAELELIRGRVQFDAAMRLNEQPMFDDLRTVFAIFFDNLIKDAGAGSVHCRTEQSLRFVAVVFDLDDAGIGAGSARRRRAKSRGARSSNCRRSPDAPIPATQARSRGRPPR